MDWNELLNTSPETVINKNSQVTGDIQFNHLLRIDGSATGRIIAPLDANLIVSRSGTYRGNIGGLSAVFVDGKVHGGITAQRIFLGPHAVVRGDVYCQKFSCSGTASVIGGLHINPNAPIDTSFACTHLVKEDMLLSPAKPSLNRFSNQNDDVVTYESREGAIAPDNVLVDETTTPRAHTPTHAEEMTNTHSSNTYPNSNPEEDAILNESTQENNISDPLGVDHETANGPPAEAAEAIIEHTAENSELPQQQLTEPNKTIEGVSESESHQDGSQPTEQEEPDSSVPSQPSGTKESDKEAEADKPTVESTPIEQGDGNHDLSSDVVGKGGADETQKEESTAAETAPDIELQPKDNASAKDEDAALINANETHVVETQATETAPEDAAAVVSGSEPPEAKSEEKQEASPLHAEDQRHNWLLIVEPQIDFYTGGQWCSSTSASAALAGVQKFISQHMEKIHRIVVFLDMHYGLEVEDSAFWRNAQDQSPAVGTIITLQDVESGLWSVADPESNQELQIAHIKSLLEPHKLEEVEGQVPEQFRNVSVQKGIVIRPAHCQVGGTGAAVHTALQSLLSQWVNAHHHDVQYIMTRHPKDTSDSQSLHHIYDTSFAAQILPADQLFVCGQMKSHCQAYGMKDILLQIMTLAQGEGESHADMGRRIRVLRDGTAEVSNLTNSEHSYRLDSRVHSHGGWKDLEALGVHIVDSDALQL
eukprot:gene27851-33632_t